MLTALNPADVSSSMASHAILDGDDTSADSLALFGDAMNGLQSLGTDSPDLWRPIDDWQID